MTCATGTSRSVPAATTRVRRSRSVMIPSVSPASTTTHVAPMSDITRAASRIVVSGVHNTSGRRISSVTGRCAGLTAGSAPSSSPSVSSSERVT